MGFIILLLFLAIVGGLIFVKTKINNTVYRAEQHVLGSAGIGSANVVAAIDDTTEKKHIADFLAAYPSMSEQALKDQIKAISDSLIQHNPQNCIKPELKGKIDNDKNLLKMQGKNFVRIAIVNFRNNQLFAKAIYSDNRDEYDIILYMDVSENGLSVYRYYAMKGAVKGF